LFFSSKNGQLINHQFKAAVVTRKQLALPSLTVGKSNTAHCEQNAFISLLSSQLSSSRASHNENPRSVAALQ
jgi:competence protein ComGC